MIEPDLQPQIDRAYAELLAAMMHKVESIPTKAAALAHLLKKLLCSEAT